MKVLGRAGFWLGCFLLWAGCAADQDGSGRGPADAPRTPSSGLQPEAPEGGCAPAGARRCFCADGQESGMQTCSANGSLSSCLCSVAARPSGSGVQVSGGPIELCAELQGKSGCMIESYESEQLPASILFLVDRSKSMSCNPPPLQSSESCEAMSVPLDAGQASRWDVTVAALKDAFVQLQATGASASVGLTFFSNDNACGVNSKPVVNIGPLSDSNLATLGTVLDATKPDGGTPVIGATVLAYQYLHQEAGTGVECPGPGCPCAAPPCGAYGNRYVVLITDSSALTSCTATEQELQDQISQLLDVEAPKAVRANVHTFVVGAPGSEPSRGLLSELAFVGGTARNGGQCDHQRGSATGDCHFDMTTTQDFAADLAQVLQDISGAALSCQLSVPTTLDADGAQNVNVQLTAGTGGSPECLARDDGMPCDGGANGWQFEKLPDGGEDLSKVVLCGEACDRVKGDPGARVDVLVGCRSLVVE